MKKIKILIILLLIATVIIALYFKVLKKEKMEYSLIKVERGNVIQKVSESGKVEPGEEIKLSFRTSEKIEEIFVHVGEKVEAGTRLVKLNTSKLFSQLDEAKAAVEVAQAQLDKLLAGASAEEIKVSETTVTNAENSLHSAKQNLEDVKVVAKEDLDDAYNDALSVLDDAHLKSANAFNVVKSVYITYFLRADQVTITVKDNRDAIERELNKMESFLDTAKNDSTTENIDLALKETKTSLTNIFQALVIIRQTCDDPLYRDAVSSTDKISLDTQKTNINTAISNIIDSQQAISSVEATNNYNINTAAAQVLSAEGVLNKARDELLKLKTPARQEDVVFYQAKLQEAEAGVAAIEIQIKDATLLSPIAGQVVEIHKRIGETVQAAEAVISLLPENPFQVKVDIYEEDIVKVKIGDPVEIKMTAFPDETFTGRVIFIDPAGKLIDGVVYYRTTIDFNEAPSGLKPAMTADVVIKTAFRENVLVIPEKVISKKDGRMTVTILKGKELEEREITIGLKDSNSLVEVISGLGGEEEIVVPK